MLTELGTWFRSVGPDVIQGVHVALEGLKVIFGAVTTSVKTLWSAFTDFVSIFSDGIAKLFGGESLSAMEFFVNMLKVVRSPSSACAPACKSSCRLSATSSSTWTT